MNFYTCIEVNVLNRTVVLKQNSPANPVNKTTTMKSCIADTGEQSDVVEQQQSRV